MIDSPIEDGGIAQECRVFQIEMTHFLDDIDALGECSELFEKEARALQAQVH